METCSVLPHMHTQKPQACLGAQQTPVAVQPLVHPPCTHPAAAARLDNSWTTAFFPPTVTHAEAPTV